MFDPFYKLYSSSLWQSGTKCYVLKTNVFYKIIFQQVIPNDWEIFLRQFVTNVLPNFSKMCCYSGTGLNTGLSAKSGFLYDSKNVKAIINSG